MEYQVDDLRRLLDDFLIEWPVERLKNMTLQEYVDVGDPNTFCQWVETKTQLLGSIKGNSSFKFGIYKRKASKSAPKKNPSDDTYSWRSLFGETRQKAFAKVRINIALIAELSFKGEFGKIHDIQMNKLFKWKIAFLYSNERLLPIYKSATIRSIAKSFNIDKENKPNRADVLLTIMSKKPSSLTIYEYANELHKIHGSVDTRIGIKSYKNNKKRRGISRPTYGSGERKGTSKTNITYKHAELQDRLKSNLEKKYPTADITLEENYIDIKVKLDNKILFYEIKTRGTASDCIRDGLGQLLAYVVNDNDEREKEIFIASDKKPGDEDKYFINYLKLQLQIKFEYEVI